MNTQISIIGKPHSGKTTFIVQLYNKLSQKGSAVTFYKNVENLEPIIKGVLRLANGDEVDPTPTEKSAEILLPINLNGSHVDLFCPDYGGEQINTMIQQRNVSPEWTKTLNESNHWLLFIRPSSLHTSFDLSNKTVKEENTGNNQEAGDSAYSISDQTSYIELLQIILFADNNNNLIVNSKVKLTIVLSCYDEAEHTGTPAEMFAKHLPLLDNFIKSNWKSELIKVIGLSSLEFSLKDDKNKKKYQENGPESYGYIVNAKGKKIKDISELLVEVIS